MKFPVLRNMLFPSLQFENLRNIQANAGDTGKEIRTKNRYFVVPLRKSCLCQDELDA